MNYIETERNELRTNRENFLAYEHGEEYVDSYKSKKYSKPGDSDNSDEEVSPRDQSPPAKDDDDDSEEDRWEKEQIRKGVLISQVGKSNQD